MECGKREDAHGARGSSSYGPNDVTIHADFLSSSTEWVPVKDFLRDAEGNGIQCLVTVDVRSEAQPSISCSGKSEDPTCTLTLKSQRHKTSQVGGQFSAYANAISMCNNAATCRNDKGKDAISTCNTAMCRNDTGTLPAELNFAFCGNLVEGSKQYPMCFAQGSTKDDWNNWYLASPQAGVTCKSGTSNEFHIPSNGEP